MICKNCPDRPHCCSPCSRLQRRLDLVTGYQREQLKQPDLLNQIFSGGEKTESEMEWENLIDQLKLPRLVSRMRHPMRELIRGYFWEGKSVPAMARRLKISRSRAQRLFDAGMKSIKRAVLKNQKARARMLPTRNKVGYNKNSRDGKKQSQ